MSLSHSSGEPLVIISKSAWTPSIRREHAFATLAAAHGHPVTFVERPLDVRALGRVASAGQWWRGVRGVSPTDSGGHDIRVVRQATILPGHRNDLGEVTHNFILRRALSRAPDDAVVVVNVPWDWPATGSVAGRRVLDCADDWRALMGHRRERLTELYRRIGDEADAVIVADASLVDQFPADRTIVVRNGVSDDMLGPLVPPVNQRRLVHAGTLTPRFDAELAAHVLELLPDWTLDLYGQCQYPRAQERPGPELLRLFSACAPRVRWHGVLRREALSAAIDRADVALVLNRSELSQGQDSMKLYDYAARGRPIVTTRFSERLLQDGPPHTRVAEDAREMADAIRASRCEPWSWVEDRRRWAEQQRWALRWSTWSEAVFGVAIRPAPA
jgi:hypothetical protein